MKTKKTLLLVMGAFLLVMHFFKWWPLPTEGNFWGTISMLWAYFGMFVGVGMVCYASLGPKVLNFFNKILNIEDDE